MARPLSIAVQTTYANLLQAHLNRPQFDFDGAPFLMNVKGKKYWYANERLSEGAIRKRYIGPDNEQMRDRIDRMRADGERIAEFRQHASELVAQLRAARVRGLDRQTGSILRALANSGVFRLGGTLVGTQAFRHYDLELGAAVSGGASSAEAQFAQTDDLDIASFQRLSMAIDDRTDPDLPEALSKLGFRPAPTLHKHPTTWTSGDGSYAVDFLTPSFDERQGPRRLQALNVWAHGFHYLDFLIKAPIPAVSVYMEGLLVQIPAPERYAVHKLIVSEDRAVSLRAKVRKDRLQARALIEALAQTRPHELTSALKEARGRGEKGWRSLIDRALTIDFNAPLMRHDFDRDVVVFEGRALESAHRCLVTGEALDDHFEAASSTPEDRLTAARAARSKIEALLQAKFRAEPASETLLTTADVDVYGRELKTGAIKQPTRRRVKKRR